MAEQIGKDPDVDTAARTGNFALLLFSIVAAIAGTVLPQLTRRDPRLLDVFEHTSEENEYLYVQRTLVGWKEEAIANGKRFKLPSMPYTLRDIWCFALILYGIISLCTFFIYTVSEVRMAVSGFCLITQTLLAGHLRCVIDRHFMGSCRVGSFRHNNGGIRLLFYSEFVRNHIPFDQFLKEIVDQPPQVTERSPLLDAGERAIHETSYSHHGTGGTVLGIHNLAIVFPQFIV